MLLIPQENDIASLPKGLLDISRPFTPVASARPYAQNSLQASHNGNNNSTGRSGIDIVRRTPRRRESNANNASYSAPPSPEPQRQAFTDRRSTGSPQEQPRQELSFEALAALAKSVVMITAIGNDNTPLAAFSGIIVGSHGYILTNNHAVRNGSAFLVRIENDNNVYQAYQVIKYHTNFDLAIIRIARECEPIRVYGGTEDLARGQKVCAIGSPMGLFNSISDGIISGFRKLDDMDMIQFTAPISDGCSGGALLNMQGELIGICTAGIKGQNLNLAVSYRQIIPFIQGFV